MGLSICGNLRTSVHVSVSEGTLHVFICEWVSIYVCVCVFSLWEKNGIWIILCCHYKL